VPILILTTESDGSKRTEAKNLGATGWLVKPVESRELIKVIKRFFLEYDMKSSGLSAVVFALSFSFSLVIGFVVWISMPPYTRLVSFKSAGNTCRFYRRLCIRILPYPAVHNKTDLRPSGEAARRRALQTGEIKQVNY